MHQAWCQTLKTQKMEKTPSPRFGKHIRRSWRQKWKYTALLHEENAEETAGASLEESGSSPNGVRRGVTRVMLAWGFER